MSNTLPQGWVEEELENLGTTVTGGTPSKKNSEYYGNDVLWIKPSELTDSPEAPYVTDSPEKLSFLGAEKIRKVNKDAVLVCCIGSIGKLGIASVDLRTNQQINSIKFNNDKILDKFGYYACYNARKDFINYSSKAIVPILNKSSFEKIKICYPTNKEEQRYIVKVLNYVANMIKLRKETISKTQDLIPALFQDMFGDPITNPKGWGVNALGKVCDIRDGTHNSPKFFTEGFPLVTSKNLINGKIDFNNVSFISAADYNEINKRSFVDNGDILLAMIGTIGNPVIVKKERDFAIKNVALIKFYKKSEVKNIFVKSFLDIITDVLKSQSVGATQKFISLSFIRKYNIIVPPLPLQEEFAKKVTEINQYLATQEKDLEKLQNLFDQLLQKAFTGALTRGDINGK